MINHHNTFRLGDLESDLHDGITYASGGSWKFLSIFDQKDQILFVLGVLGVAYARGKKKKKYSRIL
jgi:hypothetical protein